MSQENSTNTTNTTNITNTSSDIIDDIQNLQSIELELFETLETGLTNNTLSQEEQDKLTDKINKISQMRISLYKDINEMYTYYQGSVTNIEYVINQQLSAVIVIENELNVSKLRLQQIEKDKNNKIRLVEINTYYSEQYENNTQIMKVVVIACCIIIVLSILHNKLFLPNILYIPLIIIVVVASIIILWYKVLDSYSHDNMNYQEYNWDQPSASLTYDTSNPNGSNPWASKTPLSSMCSGQECCDTGYTYVSEPNKCIINSNLPTGIIPYSASPTTSTETIESTGTSDTTTATAETTTTSS